MLAGTEKRRAALGLAAAAPACAAENSGYSRQVYRTGGDCRPIIGGSQNPRPGKGSTSSRTTPRPRPFARNPRPGDRAAFACSSVIACGWVIRSKSCTPWPIARQPCSCCSSWRPKRRTAGARQSTPRRFRNGRNARSIRRRHRPGPLSRKARPASGGLAPGGAKVGAQFVPFVAEDVCRTWDLSPLVKAEALAV